MSIFSINCFYSTQLVRSEFPAGITWKQLCSAWLAPLALPCYPHFLSVYLLTYYSTDTPDTPLPRSNFLHAFFSIPPHYFYATVSVSFFLLHLAIKYGWLFSQARNTAKKSTVSYGADNSFGFFALQDRAS